jgi:hypothetical protein
MVVMLKPQDVFLLFEQFHEWFLIGARREYQEAKARDPNCAFVQLAANGQFDEEPYCLWEENTPCVPGSYGISIQ